MNNMKKRMNFWLMAALVCGLSLGVTSCKDDDDNGSEKTSTVTLDSDLLTRGIETEMKSDAIDVKVTADGLWTATLGKNADWVMIKDWQVTYEGSQTLTLLFDENPTGYDRTTTLTIGNSDGEFQEVTVRQTPLIDGKAPTNGSGLAFAGQGVGCGVDYDYVLNVQNKAKATATFDPYQVKKPNNIFNIAYIEELQKKGAENGGLGPLAYQEAPIELTQLAAAMIDESMVSKKKFDATLTMSCNFGAINFSAHGKYTSTKKQSYSNVDYVITRFSPMYNVTLSPAEIRTFASNDNNNDLSDSDEAAIKKINTLVERYARMNKQRGLTGLNSKGLTEKQQAQIDAMNDRVSMNTTWGGVFSTAFTSSYNKLFNALVSTSPDYTAADQALNQIDNDFGPFFIAGGNFGGTIVVHCHATDLLLDGSGNISGKVKIGYGGAFDLEGGFSLSDSGKEMFHEAAPNFYVYGGNDKDTANDLWDIVMGKKLDDRTRWSNTLRNWVNSMYTADDKKPIMSKAAPMSFYLEPIWTLFDDPAIQKYAQDYFIKKYEDRGIKGYLSIALNLANATADDLFDADSDFWKKSKLRQIPQISKASDNYNKSEDK